MNKPLKITRGGISVRFEREELAGASGYTSTKSSTSGDSFVHYKNAFLPSLALLPFLQDKGQEAICMVSKGDYVQEGQVIAKTKDNSMVIHASVPGKLVDIKAIPLPCGKVGQAAVLDFCGSFSFLGKNKPRDSWQQLDVGTLFYRLKNAVIVNTADVPTALNTQVEALKSMSDISLVVRLFEKDPSYVLDSFLLNNFAQDIIQGISILAKVTKVKSLIIVAGNPKSFPFQLDDFYAMCSQYIPDTCDMQFFFCEERYPIGKTKELLTSLSVRLPDLDVSSSLVVDTSTAKAIFDCVETNTPVLEKFVYIGGSGVRCPSMLKARIGTKIGDLIEECGGFSEEPARIIVNGQFAGTAIYDFDTPITKSTLAINVLPKSDFKEYNIVNCIHCGACVQVCPVGINPIKIYTYLKSKKYDEALKEQADLCHGCGACCCVCPARVPLLQLFLMYKFDYVNNKVEVIK